MPNKAPDLGYDKLGLDRLIASPFTSRMARIKQRALDGCGILRWLRRHRV